MIVSSLISSKLFFSIWYLIQIYPWHLISENKVDIRMLKIHKARLKKEREVWESQIPGSLKVLNKSFADGLSYLDVIWRCHDRVKKWKNVRLMDDGENSEVHKECNDPFNFRIFLFWHPSSNSTDLCPISFLFGSWYNTNEVQTTGRDFYTVSMAKMSVIRQGAYAILWSTNYICLCLKQSIHHCVANQYQQGWNCMDHRCNDDRTWCRWCYCVVHGDRTEPWCVDILEELVTSISIT